MTHNTFLNCPLLAEIVSWFENCQPLNINELGDTYLSLTIEAIGFLIAQAPSIEHLQKFLPLIQTYIKVHIQMEIIVYSIQHSESSDIFPTIFREAEKRKPTSDYIVYLMDELLEDFQQPFSFGDFYDSISDALLKVFFMYKIQ